MARTGRRAYRRHGHRHPAGRAVRPAPAAVQLLQAALRTGDQPAHRRHPGEESSPPPASMWAPTATCWKTSPTTARCSRSTTPSSTSTDLLKIKYMNVAGLQGRDRLHQLLQEHQLWKRRIDRALRGSGPGIHATVPTSSSCPTGTSTNTMSPSPVLLAVSAVEQYLIRTKKSTALAHHSGKSPSRATCTTLPPCWATVPAPSTRIWPMRPSASSSTQGLLDKDYYAAVNDYNKAILQRHREDRLQDGHLHHPVLPEQPRSSRQSASRRTSSTNTSPARSAVWAASVWKTFRPTSRPSTTAAFDPLGLDIDMELFRRRCPQVPQRQGRASVQPADHPPAPESLLDRRLQGLQGLHPHGGRPGRGAACICAACSISTTPQTAAMPIEEVEPVYVHRQAVQDRRP